VSPVLLLQVIVANVSIAVVMISVPLWRDVESTQDPDISDAVKDRRRNRNAVVLTGVTIVRVFANICGQ
jgi:hypothetical protein